MVKKKYKEKIASVDKIKYTIQRKKGNKKTNL